MARPVPRIGGQPMNEANTGWKVVMATVMQSNMATSTCSPTPERLADRRAAVAPTAAYVPASHSPTRPPAASGGFSGSPRVAVEPHAACSVNSVAGRPAHGPSHPNGVIDTTTKAGFSSRSAFASTGSSTTRMSAAATSGCPTRFDACRYSYRPPLPAGIVVTTSAPASARSLVQ